MTNESANTKLSKDESRVNPELTSPSINTDEDTITTFKEEGTIKDESRVAKIADEYVIIDWEISEQKISDTINFEDMSSRINRKHWFYQK